MTPNDVRQLPTDRLYEMRIAVLEEIRRRGGAMSGRPKQDFCLRGHARTIENVHPKSGRCRECSLVASKASYETRRPPRKAITRKLPPSNPESPPPPTPIDHTQCNPPRGNSHGSLCPECRAEWLIAVAKMEYGVKPEWDAYKEVAR